MNPIKLWQDNKILFFLLLPIILLILFKDIIITLIASGAHKNIDAAAEKDDKLKSDAQKHNVEAEIHKERAKEIENKIKNNNERDIPLDWNKRDDWGN